MVEQRKKMKSVLMISYYYFPFAGVASQRAEKFFKYLPDYGWIVHIFCANPKNYGNMVRNERSSLIENKNTAINLVHRMPYFGFRKPASISRILFTISSFFFFLKNRKSFNAVYITGFPFTPFILTFFIKKFKVPSIIDFRDSWSINHGFNGIRKTEKTSRVREYFFRLIERFSIKSATKVLFATSYLQLEYEKIFPEYRKKFHTIHNGYDPDDIREISPERISEKKTVVLAGKFFIYTPDAVDALMQALKAEQKIHFVYVGEEHSIITSYAERYSVTNQVSSFSFKPQKEVLRLIAGADVGLVTNGMVNGLGTKIFEYLALKKPTICLVPDGSVISMEFGNTSSVIISHPPHTKEKIIEAFCKAFGMKGIKQQEDLSRFNRIENTRNLAELLNDMTR